MTLHRLLYRSEMDTGPDSESRIAAVLTSARRNNRVSGLSGVLLAANGIVIQILEGPPEPLEATFERICCDLRHRNVKLLEFSPIEERGFPDLGMRRIPVSEESRLLVHALQSGEGLSEAAITEAAMQLLRTLVLTGPAERPAHPASARRA